MPKKILTKKAKQWFVWLGKRIGAHLITYIIIVLVLIGVYYAYKSNIFDTVIQYEDAPKAGTYRKLEVRGNNVTISEIDKATDKTLSEKKYYSRYITFIQDDTGFIEGRIQKTAFIFEPGYSAFFTGEGPAVGINVKWWYWQRWGLSSGIGVGRRSDSIEDKSLALRAYPAAVNYDIPFKWTPNTSVFLGYDLKSIVVGTSVRW